MLCVCVCACTVFEIFLSTLSATDCLIQLLLQAAEFWELGLEPLPISAISGTGTGELLDALVETLPAPTGMEMEDESDKPLAIAIVGRPNVGE